MSLGRDSAVGSVRSFVVPPDQIDLNHVDVAATGDGEVIISLYGWDKFLLGLGGGGGEGGSLPTSCLVTSTSS